MRPHRAHALRMHTRHALRAHASAHERAQRSHVVFSYVRCVKCCEDVGRGQSYLVAISILCIYICNSIANIDLLTIYIASNTNSNTICGLVTISNAGKSKS